MITKDTTEDSTLPTGNSKATEATQEPREPTVDSPPPYQADSSNRIPVSRQPNASNFVTVRREHGSINGTYAIDPTLVMPSVMLPPLEDGEERKNLNLYSQYGNVEADVTILPVDNHGAKVTIYAKSSHCSVRCKLHRSSNSPALSFEGHSMYAHVKVFLPRSFQGPVTATTVYGAIKVSDAVAARQTPFSDVDKTSKFFIGDVSRYLEEGKNWDGDEVVVGSSHGSIKISYDDEINEGKGLFGKIWDSMTSRVPV